MIYASTVQVQYNLYSNKDINRSVYIGFIQVVKCVPVSLDSFVCIFVST
jgi:hypothetical protein